VFPFVVAAPRYFSGAIQLGGLMQTGSAFGQLQESSPGHRHLPELPEWKATVDRLTVSPGPWESPPGGRAHGMASATKHLVKRLEIEKSGIEVPQGRPLLSSATIQLQPGEMSS